jgi:parvulin-like peptidyl-prolyl isomerase
MLKKCLALFLACAVAVPVLSEERRGDAPLVVNGATSLTTTDFQAYLEKVPEQIRGDFAANVERVKKTVDGLWVQRRVAQRARADGLDKDPIIAARLQQAQEAVLVEAYLINLEKRMKYPDLLPRAREVYAAQKDKFKDPGRVHVQHILVDMKCRKRDEAVKRAEQLRTQILNGKEEFTAVARRESDDPAKDKNGGDLGLMALKDIPNETFRKQVEQLAKPGDISAPFETNFGMHIVRLVKREPEKQRSFEEVKDEIIAAEKQKMLDDARTQVLLAVRNDPNNHLHLENVEALAQASRPPSSGTNKAR